MKAALRLRKPADFARVRRSGAVFPHRDLVLSVCRNEAPHNRYGIVASRQLGNAVARNRCKRRLRAILRQMHAQLAQGFDIVIIAKPALTRQPFDELQRIVDVLMRRARLIGHA